MREVAALPRLAARRGIRNTSALAVLGLALAAVAVVAIGTGPIAIAPARVLAALGAGLGLPLAVDPRDLAVVLVLRVPRTLMAALVGAVLGAAGAVMQGLFRNPLADPGLLGVSAGGAVGAAVAATGTIGFIGIVAPHLVRLARGADHAWVLPGAALTGAALLVAADAAARTVLAPAELPIGLVTALIGGPFFLALLMRQRLQVDGR
jgi:iron complex transport system permease protein